MMHKTAAITYFIIIFLYIYWPCGAQLTLSTCGDEDSDITCSFFFNKIDNVFREENVLYTLRRLFFPVNRSPPDLLSIEMTLIVENIPNIRCTDPDYNFGESPVNNPPQMSDVCRNYTCESRQWTWEHRWSKSIVNFIIDRENLELLQDTNFVAFATATFNSFDTSVFGREGSSLGNDSNNNNNNRSLATSGRRMVEFLLNLDFLPCRPDDGVLLSAWEDILPWVSVWKK